MSTTVTPQTKTEQAKKLFASGAETAAMKIFRTFKIGFTCEEKRTIEIAYECQTGNEAFYKSIGVNTSSVRERAKEIIRNKYSI